MTMANLTNDSRQDSFFSSKKTEVPRRSDYKKRESAQDKKTRRFKAIVYSRSK